MIFKVCSQKVLWIAYIGIVTYLNFFFKPMKHFCEDFLDRLKSSQNFLHCNQFVEIKLQFRRILLSNFWKKSSFVQFIFATIFLGGLFLLRQKFIWQKLWLLMNFCRLKSLWQCLFVHSIQMSKIFAVSTFAWVEETLLSW